MDKNLRLSTSSGSTFKPITKGCITSVKSVEKLIHQQMVLGNTRTALTMEYILFVTIADTSFLQKALWASIWRGCIRVSCKNIRIKWPRQVMWNTMKFVLGSFCPFLETFFLTLIWKLGQFSPSGLLTVQFYDSLFSSQGMAPGTSWTEVSVMIAWVLLSCTGGWDKLDRSLCFCVLLSCTGGGWLRKAPVEQTPRYWSDAQSHQGNAPANSLLWAWILIQKIKLSIACWSNAHPTIRQCTCKL